jgi:hypothetical protein
MRRSLTPPPGRVRRDDGTIARIVGPTKHPLDDMVCWSDLTEETADAAIDTLLAEADREERALQWNVYGHDAPKDLVERLVRRGFVAQGEERILVLPTDAFATVAPPPAGLEITRVVEEAGLDPVVRVQEVVWGSGHTEWLLAWWRPALRGEGDPIGIFLARIDGALAGAAWVLLPHHGSFASLFGGTVLPPFRRRGAHRALVAARAGLARQAGIPWLTVDGNAQSAPLLRRLGFSPLATRIELVREPHLEGQVHVKAE